LIQPGEEISISYHDKAVGLTLEHLTAKALRLHVQKANRVRNAAPTHLKCFCKSTPPLSCIAFCLLTVVS